MDSSGVPKKINRHVFKALDFFTLRKGNCDVAEVLDYVRQCNKNLQPVRNFKNAVQKSLLNLEEAGLAEKFGKGLYRICSVDKPKSTKEDHKPVIRWKPSHESLCDSLADCDVRTKKPKRSRRRDYSGPPKQSRYIRYATNILDETDSDVTQDDDRKSISTQFSQNSYAATDPGLRLLNNERSRSNIDVREEPKNQENVKLEEIEIPDKDTNQS